MTGSRRLNRRGGPGVARRARLALRALFCVFPELSVFPKRSGGCRRPGFQSLSGLAGALGLLVGLAALGVGAQEQRGGFTVSPAYGAVTVLAVSAAGAPDSPLLVEIDHRTPGPVRLMIRNDGFVSQRPGVYRGFQHLSILLRVRNASDRTWIGYDLELQAEAGTPSDYWDGLSFNQPSRIDAYGGFRSDLFETGQRIAEPADRVRFHGGAVDAGGVVEFRFVVTDTTPERDFYLMLEPVFVYA
ncbi:MAG: hypothetical protein QNJ84_16110 [Alphaproteobacteria bacterium]|nr:hypothetical protein [Alphaproteobacteria bacterium]